MTDLAPLMRDYLAAVVGHLTKLDVMERELRAIYPDAEPEDLADKALRVVPIPTPPPGLPRTLVVALEEAADRDLEGCRNALVPA